jgi:hypothetical protein
MDKPGDGGLNRPRPTLGRRPVEEEEEEAADAEKEEELQSEIGNLSGWDRLCLRREVPWRKGLC